MTTRRSFLISTSTLGLVSAFGGAAFSQGRFEVVHTPAEWRQILSEDAYFVMREEQTEPPGYSPLAQKKSGKEESTTRETRDFDLPVTKEYDLP